MPSTATAAATSQPASSITTHEPPPQPSPHDPRTHAQAALEAAQPVQPQDSMPDAAAAAASQPSPPSPRTRASRPQSTLANRIIALTLYNEGFPTKYILQKSGLKRASYFYLLKKAKERGFVRGDPPTEALVVDSPRSGRPQIIDKDKAEQLEAFITRNSATGQYLVAELSQAIQKEHGWQASRMTIRRFMKKSGLRNGQVSTKPGQSHEL